MSIDYVVIEDIIDHETGELFVESGKELNESIISTLKKSKTKSIKVVDVRNNLEGALPLKVKNLGIKIYNGSIISNTSGRKKIKTVHFFDQLSY